MTIRLRLSDSGDAHFGSSDPTSQRVPSSEPTDAEVVGQAFNPLSVVEYGHLIMTERAKNDPAYRRELDARLAADHYYHAPQTPQPVNTVDAIIAADSTVNPNIAQLGVERGPFISREARAAAYADPRYATSQDWRDLTIARDALTDF